MGRKLELPSYKVIDTGDMSGSITSSTSTIDQMDKVNLQVSWSAGSSPVGTIAVQVRQSYKNSGLFSNWVSLSFDSSISISGNSGDHLIHLDLGKTKFDQMRVVYTRTSGSGTLDVTVNGAVVGA